MRSKPHYHLIKIPRVDDALQAIVNIVPLQLLSYHLTLLRGFNVDQPRNLAKSVTVTEEVSRTGAGQSCALAAIARHRGAL